MSCSELGPAPSTPERHLLIRYSEGYLCPPRGTLVEHEDVLIAKGRVVIGKFGQPVGDSAIRYLQERIDNEDAPTLFLVGSDDGKIHDSFRCRIVAVHPHLPAKLSAITPAYYRRSLVGTSFVVDTMERLSDGELGRLHVISSNSPVVESLRTSMRGFFWVRAREPATNAPSVEKRTLSPEARRELDLLREAGF